MVREQDDRVEAVGQNGPVTPDGWRAPEREWSTAALAHASVLLTVVLGVPAGLGVPIGLAVPLTMYFGYRHRSRFVAFHALQAFVYQMVGALVGAVLVATGGGMCGLAGALAEVFFGLPLVPPLLLLVLLVGLLLLGLPLIWVAYGLYAAYQVYQGTDFHYLLIGDPIEREVRAWYKRETPSSH